MTSSSTQEWAQSELATLDLGDERRNRRAVRIVQRLLDRPGGLITTVCDGPAEAKATYRFLSNPAVSPDALRAALRDATVARLADEPVVLVPQDTTSVDFSAHPATTGLGPTSGGPHGGTGHGLHLHSAIAVSAEGVPLGLLHQQDWARDPAQTGRKHRRKERPFEDKESYRWQQTVQAVEAAVPADKLLVQTADREGDIYEVFATPRRPGSYLLIRSCQDRRLQGEERRLWGQVADAPVAHGLEMMVHTKRHLTPRCARLQLRYRTVTLRPPISGTHDPGLEPVTLTALEVREVDPPPLAQSKPILWRLLTDLEVREVDPPPLAQSKPILWRLLTDLPTESVADALRHVRWYALRWLVERYHFVLKSGCQLETSQLHTLERLERLLVLCSAVAVRLLWMTYSARVHPEVPCTVAFSTVEWQVLYRHQRKTLDLPAQPPSLRDAVRWLALLGGFMGRKGDGEPGVKVLWRGLTRLQDIVTGFLLTSPDVGNA